jgi:hypothetical protein
MKWTHVCPLLGVALFACATGENEFPGPLGLGTGGDAAGGSTDGGSSSAAGVGGSFVKGGSSAGGMAGMSTAGTFGFSGATSFAGTFSSAGTATAGGSGAGGAGGAGGKASGGAGGTGGQASSGAGGTGGGATTQCAGSTIPAKNTWRASASPDDGDPPDNVHDGDNTTRYASGHAQNGEEWLEVNFGKVVTINEITMHTNNNDYFRHYQLRLSSKSQDFAAAILKEDDGKTGTIVVPLAQTHAGQYLTIRQTGMVSPTWWSLYEVSVACK